MQATIHDQPTGNSFCNPADVEFEPTKLHDSKKVSEFMRYQQIALNLTTIFLGKTKAELIEMATCHPDALYSMYDTIKTAKQDAEMFQSIYESAIARMVVASYNVDDDVPVKH